MILVAALDVEPAKSPASSSTVRIPRSCASRAQADPVAPPPMTHRSNCCPEMLCSSSALVFIFTLKVLERYFRPESQDRCIRQIGIGTYTDVILKYGLKQEVRGDLKGIVHFVCFFRAKECPPEQFAELLERIADLAIHEGTSNAVFFSVLKRSIQSRTRRELNVFSAHVTGTIVKTECCIEAPLRSGIGTEDSLACHPVDQMVPAAPVSRRV